MKRISDKLLAEAVMVAEIKTGTQFSERTVQDILQHSCRKLRIIKKDLDYLPILFENELTDHVMREQVTMKGAVVNV